MPSKPISHASLPRATWLFYSTPLAHFRLSHMFLANLPCGTFVFEFSFRYPVYSSIFDRRMLLVTTLLRCQRITVAIPRRWKLDCIFELYAYSVNIKIFCAKAHACRYVRECPGKVTCVSRSRTVIPPSRPNSINVFFLFDHHSYWTHAAVTYNVLCFWSVYSPECCFSRFFFALCSKTIFRIIESVRMPLCNRFLFCCRFTIGRSTAGRRIRPTSLSVRRDRDPYAYISSFIFW